MGSRGLRTGPRTRSRLGGASGPAPRAPRRHPGPWRALAPARVGGPARPCRRPLGNHGFCHGFPMETHGSVSRARRVKTAGFVGRAAVKHREARRHGSREAKSGSFCGPYMDPDAAKRGVRLGFHGSTAAFLRFVCGGHEACAGLRCKKATVSYTVKHRGGEAHGSQEAKSGSFCGPCMDPDAAKQGVRLGFHGSTAAFLWSVRGEPGRSCALDCTGSALFVCANTRSRGFARPSRAKSGSVVWICSGSTLLNKGSVGRI